MNLEIALKLHSIEPAGGKDLTVARLGWNPYCREQARNASFCYSEMGGIDFLCIVGGYWLHYYIDRSYGSILYSVHDNDHTPRIYYDG